MPRAAGSGVLALLLAALVATLPAGAPPARAEAPAAPGGAGRAAPSIDADPIEAEGAPHRPYLTDATAPDTRAILPPPPVPGSAAEAADRAAFDATRGAADTPRWALAASDVEEGAAAILENFACVLGRRVDGGTVPALMSLLERSRLDVARAVRDPKRLHRRARPFVGNAAPICVERTKRLTASYSYPSGHATEGWAFALIMASLLPERASPFLVRGRLYGESRVVCGVHWLSDIEAARTAASAVVATLQGNAEFRADFERARADLNRALAAPGTRPDPAICTREDEAVRARPF